MTALDDAKAKVDTNNDGKLSLDELDKARNGKNSEAIDHLKNQALKYDGKVNIKGEEKTVANL
jgi:hypothetical protein